MMVAKRTKDISEPGISHSHGVGWWLDSTVFDEKKKQKKKGEMKKETKEGVWKLKQALVVDVNPCCFVHSVTSFRMPYCTVEKADSILREHQALRKQKKRRAIQRMEGEPARSAPM